MKNTKYVQNTLKAELKRLSQAAQIVPKHSILSR